jgi:hypothetical protein
MRFPSSGDTLVMGSKTSEAVMPLSSVQQAPTSNNERRALGWWMTVEGTDPIKPVYVFVTYEALAELEPSHPRDLAALLAIFDEHRPELEAMASILFDERGFDFGEYQDQPTVSIQLSDLA